MFRFSDAAFRVVLPISRNDKAFGKDVNGRAVQIIHVRHFASLMTDRGPFSAPGDRQLLVQKG